MKFGKNQRWKQCWCYSSCWKLFEQALRDTFSLNHEWSLTFLRDTKRAKYRNAWKLLPACHLPREWGFSRALACRSLINYRWGKWRINRSLYFLRRWGKPPVLLCKIRHRQRQSLTCVCSAGWWLLGAVEGGHTWDKLIVVFRPQKTYY